MNRHLLTLAAFLCATPMAPSAATSIINGSFETFTGSVGANGTRILAGSTALTGWTIAGEVGILAANNNYNLSAADASRFLDLTSVAALDGGAGHGIEQLLTGLTPGQRYRVSMDLGASLLPCVGGLVNCAGPVTVAVNTGPVAGSIDFDAGSATDGWFRFSQEFQASGTSAPLRITLLAVDGYYAGLDNVSISAVPETSTVAVLALGLAAIGAARTVTRQGRRPD